ncbi:MAG: hypothetical protein ACXABY_17665 [Candidatus Thorarchaeota archaeon]
MTIPPDGREIRHETREDAPRREKIEREYPRQRSARNRRAERRSGGRASKVSRMPWKVHIIDESHARFNADSHSETDEIIAKIGNWYLLEYKKPSLYGNLWLLHFPCPSPDLSCNYGYLDEDSNGFCVGCRGNAPDLLVFALKMAE